MSPRCVCTFPDARHKDGICGRPITVIYRHRPSRRRYDRCASHDTAAARAMVDDVGWTREAVA